MSTARPYPTPWAVEMTRNHSGRAFYLVSRFTSRTSAEYVLDVEGKPRWFRWLQEAVSACNRANASEGQT